MSNSLVKKGGNSAAATSSYSCPGDYLLQLHRGPAPVGFRAGDRTRAHARLGAVLLPDMPVLAPEYTEDLEQRVIMDIVRRTLPLTQLSPAEYNPRQMSNKDRSDLMQSMKEFGVVEPLVVQKKTVYDEVRKGEVHKIIGGHQRYYAAMDLFLGEVPCVVLDVDDTKAKLLNIALNKIHGDWDVTKLTALVDELRLENADVSLTGFDEPSLVSAGVLPKPEKGQTEPDAVPAAPRKAITATGDLWTLGEHRLLCGDATKAEDVERLMDGSLADMMLTDPPYGVSYVGKTADALTIESDDMSESELSDLVKVAFDNAEAFCRAGAYWYATVPPGPLHLIFAADWKRRGILRQIMVWAKDSMVLGHSEYHYQHEPILFGWIPGDRHRNADRTRTTLWTHTRPKASREHPTMKPVELWAQAVGDGSRTGEAVYDPFVGSGTSIVTAEQLNRRCYGMEIDPMYCDVIVKRWEEFTGEKAKRE